MKEVKGMNKKIIKIAVLSVFFVQMGIGTITPAIASIAAAFPEVAFTTLLLVSTLPTLVSVPATIISGRLAGSKLNYKTLLVIGMIMFILGGVAPYFTQNFTLILLLRVIFGLGLGIVSPLGAALIIAFFDGQERAEMMGLSNVIANIGGILFQLLGGMLASKYWGYSFLAHGLGIITFILILMLPEPEKAPEPPAGQAAPKMPGTVWMYTISMLVLMMLNYPLLVNMSSVIETYGMGDASDSAMVLTMFTVGGMVAGAIFAKLFGVFKSKVMAVGLSLMTLAMVCLYFGNSIAFMYAGSTLSGIGFSMIMPTIMMQIGAVVPPAQVSTASGMIVAGMNVGGFVSAYFFAAVSGIFGKTGDLKFPYLVAIICFAIGSLGLLFKKDKQVAQA